MVAMKKMMMLAVAMTLITAVIGGEVYIVGDDAGWTNVAHVNYKTWASSKVFRVGDTIVFKYVTKFHNVARVTFKDFKTCNSSNPHSTFTTGNDSFHIKYPGHYYFICTQAQHCNAGEKVDIRVHPKPAHRPSPSPIQPLPFPYPQPFAPSTSPAQSPLTPPAQSPSPAHTTPQAPSPIVSIAPRSVPVQVPPMSQVPAPSPAQSPSPAHATPQAPSPIVSIAPPSVPVQVPPMPQASAPSLKKESPSPTPSIPAPEVAPSQKKNMASRDGSLFNTWMTMMVALFCFGISF